MKKLISIFLIFNLCFCLFAETIKIETSKGETDLVIPETQEDLREAFIEMSKLYVEERYAYDDLIEASKEVDEAFKSLKEINLKNESLLNTYIEENKKLRTQYGDLVTEYDRLVDTMNKRAKAAPIKGILAVELNFTDNFTGTKPAVELGAYVFEKVMITSRVSYPWELGIGIGFTF